MNLYYTNANDLRNKFHELSLVAKQFDCKLLCVTETMFSNEILDSEIFIPNFKIFRTDRIGKKGGGSCIYVHDTLIATIVSDFNVPDCIAIKLNTGIMELIVIVIYRSPSLNYNDNISLINCLDTAVKIYLILPNSNMVSFRGSHASQTFWNVWISYTRYYQRKTRLTLFI